MILLNCRHRWEAIYLSQISHESEYFVIFSGFQLPPTRAKSPKLGRRKSCSDTVKPSEGSKVKGINVHANRHSLVNYKEESTIIRPLTMKDQSDVDNITAFCNFDDDPKQAGEVKMSPPNITVQGNVDIIVQS